MENMKNSRNLKFIYCLLLLFYIYLTFIHLSINNALATALQGEPSARDNKSVTYITVNTSISVIFEKTITKIALQILCIKIYIIDEKMYQNNEEETWLKIIHC